MYTKNMKPFIFAAVCSGLCACAFAAPSSQLEGVSASPARFLMSRVAAGKPITFCVHIPEQEWPSVPREDFELQTGAALYEWTQGTAQQIRQSGRAGEFSDILPLLDKARFERLPGCNLTEHPEAARFFPANSSVPAADISIIASPDYCGEISHRLNAFFVDEFYHASPFICFGARYSSLLEPVDYSVKSICREPADQAILSNAKTILQTAAKGNASAKTRRDLWRLNRCYSYEKGALFGILVHELGHAFGAADEYTAENNDPLYSSAEPQDGIMRGEYDKFGCSETDTAVLLLDRFLHRKRTFASFCQNGITFKNGVQTVLHTTPVKAVLQPGRTVLLSLTADSPARQTLLAEVWEREFSEDTRAVLLALGENAETDGAEVYCAGRQKSGGSRTGVWEYIFSRGGVFSGVQVRYDASGHIRRASLKKVSAAYARERFERMKNVPEQKISRIVNNLKKSF